MKVFISFSSADKKIAEKIYDRLKKKEIDCWICTKDIPPGADYQACIVEAINRAQVVVLVFSSQANSSTEIAKELSLASKKILIPARIEDVVPQGSFQYQLSNRQFVDLFEDFDNKLEDLADRIKAVLESGIETGLSPTPIKHRSKLSIGKLIKPAAIFAGIAGLVVAGWFFATKQSAPVISQQSVAIEAPKINSVPFAEARPVQKEPTVEGQVAQIEPAAEAQVAQIITSNDNQDKSTTTEVTPAVVSEKVHGLILMMGDSSNSSKLSAIKSIKDQLPNNLNYKEAEAVLEGTGGYRNNAISVVADKLTPNLGGKELSVVLGDTLHTDRLQSIKKLLDAGKIKSGLQPDELSAVLEGTGGYRKDAISAIAEKLTPNLGGKEVSAILGDTSNSYRLESVRKLVGAGKIKSGLQPTEIEDILQNIGGYRVDALKILTPYLAR